MEHYYVRLRGQVSGPYSIGQLHNLRACGQFGRFHEVSQNQAHWAPAGSVAELFPGGPPSAPTGPEPAATPVLEEVAEWYYLDADHQQQGPVSMRDLQALLDNGHVEEDAPVCKEGLPEWVSLASLPQLRLTLLPAGALSRPTGRFWRAEVALAALVAGILLALLVGFVAAAVAAYLAADSFATGDTVMGGAYLVLFSIVLALMVVGTYLLAAEHRKRRGQQETIVGRGPLSKGGVPRPGGGVA